MDWLTMLVLSIFIIVMWGGVAVWILDIPAVHNWSCKNYKRLAFVIVVSGPVLWLAVLIVYLQDTRGMFR